MKPARAVAWKRSTISAWLVVSLTGFGSLGCRDSRVELYPNSRVIIHRRYSASLVELAGMNPASVSRIAEWYDTRLKGQTVVEEEVSATVRRKRWHIADRFLEVIIVDHGMTRSILVREQGDR